MIYLHYKDTKTFGHSFSFLLIFKTLRASYLQVGNFSYIIDLNFDKNKIDLDDVVKYHIKEVPDSIWLIKKNGAALYGKR